MNNFHRKIYVLLFVAYSCISFFSCAPIMNQPLQPSRARLGVQAPGHNQLVNLPLPANKIVVSVYKFRDQTGQYKPSANGNSFSTAVTQGATSILLRALEDSQWFTPIERENLSNLLNERKIIRSSRAEYEGNNASSLPPLLFAGVIIEGGIVAYDANILTGGAGIRFFGAGSSGEYREDRVTVYLRAISTSNGQILKTVYTTKTILSQAIDAGFFRFVRFSRLLEAETGFTYNEPSELAVTEAIEKAVQSLIIEGILDDLWQIGDLAEVDHPIIKEYLEEQKLNQATDLLGREQRERRAKLAIHLSGGITRYAGDFPNPKNQALGEIRLGINLNPSFQLSLGFGQGSLASREFYNNRFTYGGLFSTVRFLPKDKYTPFIEGGIGMMQMGGVDNQIFASTGLGLEYLVTQKLGISAAVHNQYFFSDQIDGVTQGRYNDFFWTFKGGLSFYF